jgi:hypothetical protein
MTPSRPDAAPPLIHPVRYNRRRYDGQPHELLAYLDERRKSILIGFVAVAIGVLGSLSIGWTVTLAITGTAALLFAMALLGSRLLHRDRTALEDAGARIRDVQAELKMIDPSFEPDESIDRLNFRGSEQKTS